MAWITMDIIVICLILGMYKCTVGLKAQPTNRYTFAARLSFVQFVQDGKSDSDSHLHWFVSCIRQLSSNTTNAEKLMVKTANIFLHYRLNDVQYFLYLSCSIKMLNTTSKLYVLYILFSKLGFQPNETILANYIFLQKNPLLPSAPSPEGRNKLKFLNNLLQKSNLWRANNFIYIRLDL